MNSRTMVGCVSAMALVTGAAVIGQNQPTSPTRPSTTQPSTTQPSTTSPSTTGQPDRSGDQTRWRDAAQRIQGMSDRMTERSQRLQQQLAQAQTQTGEAKVNALAEVITELVREHEYTNRSILQLQRMAFREHLDSSNMGQEWDTWRQQYPFLDESKDTDNDMNGTGNDRDRDRSRDNPSTTPTTPRNPR